MHRAMSDTPPLKLNGLRQCGGGEESKKRAPTLCEPARDEDANGPGRGLGVKEKRQGPSESRTSKPTTEIESATFSNSSSKEVPERDTLPLSYAGKTWPT